LKPLHDKLPKNDRKPPIHTSYLKHTPRPFHRYPNLQTSQFVLRRASIANPYRANRHKLIAAALLTSQTAHHAQFGKTKADSTPFPKTSTQTTRSRSLKPPRRSHHNIKTPPRQSPINFAYLTHVPLCLAKQLAGPEAADTLKRYFERTPACKQTGKTPRSAEEKASGNHLRRRFTYRTQKHQPMMPKP